MPQRAQRGADRRGDSRRGALVLLAVLTLPALLLVIGLAVDGALLYVTDARLATAVRGATESAGRGEDMEDARALAEAVFAANFPEGLFMAESREIESLLIEDNEVRLTAAARAPTLFLRFLGREMVEIRRSARTPLVQRGAPVRLWADGDAFGPDRVEIEDLALRYPRCGNGDPAVCVNADTLGDGPLFQRGRDITPYENWSVHLGTSLDPAFFRPDGAALTAVELEELLGRTVCVDVYAGELGGEAEPVLQGRTAFAVTGLTPAPEGRAYLPHWIVRLADSGAVEGICARSVAFH